MLIQHLTCRDEGHNYAPPRDSEIIVNPRGKLVSYKRTHVCRRCYTERIQHIDGKTFDIISTTYKYPEDYLVKPGDPRITRREARRAVFQYYNEGV